MKYPHTPLHPISSQSFLQSADVFQVNYGNRLPHWNLAKLQFVTFRLADSLPQVKLKEYVEMKNKWKEEHPKPWSNEELAEYSDTFGGKIDEWLDSGMGECLLRDEKARELVIKTLLYDAGVKYDVIMFCVMPNHVHLLLNVYDGVSISVVSNDIKRISAHKINKLLGKSGKLWMRESFDRVIRNEKHFNEVYGYIMHNGDGLPDNDFTVMDFV